MYKNDCLPYRARDHVHVQSLGNFTSYVNLFDGSHFIMPNEAHGHIVTGGNGGPDGLEYYINAAVETLTTRHYIEPDLTKISIGQASVYIPKTRWEPAKKINVMELANVPEKCFYTPAFDIGPIQAEAGLNAYTFLCERNTVRLAMSGYGIPYPLLWMHGGLYVFDQDFLNTGLINTQFSRPMLDPQRIPIVGNIRNNLDWEIIDRHIEKGLPVLVNVDVYHMPYKSSTYYHNRHGNHCVLLLEKHNGHYLIVDWCHPDYFYGEISKKELALARMSTNEKDKDSVFTGYPIEAAYRLIYMNRFPVNLDILRYVRSNLLQSARCLLNPGGIIDLFATAGQAVPPWAKIPGHPACQNAIESFFFLDLELNFLSLYYGEMSNSGLFNPFAPGLLNEKTASIKHHVGLLKNKLIFASRRNKPIDENAWMGLMTLVNASLTDYCETLLGVLKAAKSN